MLDATGCRGVNALPAVLLDAARFPKLRDLRVEPGTQIGEFGNPDVLAQVRGKNGLKVLRTWYGGLAKDPAKNVHRRFVKVFLLGNGGAGKSQIRLLLEGKTPSVETKTTHGADLALDVAQLAEIEPEAGALKLPDTALAVWDFGGQEIYHGTHALFTDENALYVIVWTKQTRKTGEPDSTKPKTVQYWLEYVASLREDTPDAPAIDVILAESGARSGSKADYQPVPGVKVVAEVGYDLFRGTEYLEGSGSEVLRKIGKAARAIADARRQDVAGTWFAVREAVKSPEYRARNTLDAAGFAALCREKKVTPEEVEIVRGYLHESSAIFHRKRMFEGRIVVNQEWALDAIYTVLNREDTNPLKTADFPGSFTVEMLHKEAWRGKPIDRKDAATLVRMMESCNVCFRWRLLPGKAPGSTDPRDWEWIAPEMLMGQTPAQKLFVEIVGGKAADETVPYDYEMLRSDILRTLMCAMGQKAGDTLLYWKGGFLGRWGDTVVTVEHCETATVEKPGAGRIVAKRFGGETHEWNGVLDMIEKELGTQRPKPKAKPRKDDETIATFGVAPMEGAKTTGERPLQNQSFEVTFTVRECDDFKTSRNISIRIVESTDAEGKPRTASAAGLEVDAAQLKEYVISKGAAATFESHIKKCGRKQDEAIFCWEGARSALAVGRTVSLFTRLKLRGEADFHRIAWELVTDENGLEFALNASHSVQRHAPHDRSVPQKWPEDRRKLRVLWVVSRPVTNSPDSEAVIAPVKETLKAFINRGEIEITRIKGDFEAMRDELSRNRFHVVHLDMHGDLMTWADVQDCKTKGTLCPDKRGNFLGRLKEWDGRMPVLCFEEGSGMNRIIPVTAAELAHTLKNGRNPPVVVLNACHSGEVPEKCEHGALPIHLIDAGVMGVVGFQTVVTVDTARLFFGEFYTTLRPSYVGEDVRTGDPEYAVHKGRVLLESNRERERVGRERIDWWLPVFYTSQNIRLYEH